MMDNTLDIQFSADTSELLDALKTVKSAINDTFGTIKLNAQNVQTPVADLFKAMQRSSDNAIRGLIRGTETWRQAAVNIATDMEVKFAQLASHRLLNWVESELGMTQATEAGNTARVASDQSASATSLGAQAEKVISTILNDAKQVFSGIFAFLSPVMGPAAAGPAAAGSATVSALAGEIAYAESGAWNIPSNTLAYLHAGEMVVPANFASGLRNGSGLSGGDSYTININAIDTQTGAQFLKNNASVIAQTISTQARNFNKNIPVWKG
jgi:hypothetical protein